MTDTPTPRTEQEARYWDGDNNSDAVPADFARQLERELAEALRVIAWLRSGGLNRFNHTAEGIRPESVAAHLASSPEKGWKP